MDCVLFGDILEDGVVGFEKTVYSVPEDIPGGVLEICAIVYTSDSIDCPILFPFMLEAKIPRRGVVHNDEIEIVFIVSF